MSTISEVDFISPCPVQDCINKQKSYRWIHHNCGGYEKRRCDYGKECAEYKAGTGAFAKILRCGVGKESQL